MLRNVIDFHQLYIVLTFVYVTNTYTFDQDSDGMNLQFVQCMILMSALYNETWFVNVFVAFIFVGMSMVWTLIVVVPKGAEKS